MDFSSNQVRRQDEVQCHTALMVYHFHAVSDAKSSRQRFFRISSWYSSKLNYTLIEAH